MHDRQPDFTKPIDVKAYLYNGFGLCGCMEIGLVFEVIQSLLEWLSSDMQTRLCYDELFGGNVGVFYILIGAFDRLRLCNHGVSARASWIEKNGKSLLTGMKTMKPEDVENSKGEAYDGLYYD